MKPFPWIGLMVGAGLLLVHPVPGYPVSRAASATELATPGLGTPVPPQPVSIKAADGLLIVGQFYPSLFSAPAILLLHQINGSQAQWKPLIPALTGAGYNVLAVDMRGFGETRGAINWKLAQSDVAVMLAWLHDQPEVDADQIAIIGASMGANLALRGCASEIRCRVAIALSPGVEYFGVTTDDAIQKMGKKAVMLVAAQIDRESADGVKELAQLAPGNTLIRLYTGGQHGIDLFNEDDLIPTMIQWLRMHFS